jgi:hypothetical protein
LRTVPTSTIVRTSLITCSFSTACLLSRKSDLNLEIGGSGIPEGAHLRMYQSSAPPNL